MDVITECNKVALKVLDEQIAAGKKRIGIFYGRGHMPDMERRLIADVGVHRDNERWLVAWNLRRRPSAAPTRSAPSRRRQGSGQREGAGRRQLRRTAARRFLFCSPGSDGISLQRLAPARNSVRPFPGLLALRNSYTM